MSLRELSVPKDSGMLPVNWLAERKLPKDKKKKRPLSYKPLLKKKDTLLECNVIHTNAAM